LNVIRSNGKFAEQRERGLVRRARIALPPRSSSLAPTGVTRNSARITGYAKAAAIFKGTLIACAAVFVTITLALQAAARFS
jgi:hypothetical protein